MSISRGYYGENTDNDEIMMLSHMMSNINVDDDAAFAYNEVRRKAAISEINTLETTEVSVKLYKYRQREVVHARLWKEYFTDNSKILFIKKRIFDVDSECINHYLTAFWRP